MTEVWNNFIDPSRILLCSILLSFLQTQIIKCFEIFETNFKNSEWIQRRQNDVVRWWCGAAPHFLHTKVCNNRKICSDFMETKKVFSKKIWISIIISLHSNLCQIETCGQSMQVLLLICVRTKWELTSFKTVSKRFWKEGEMDTFSASFNRIDYHLHVMKSFNESKIESGSCIHSQNARIRVRSSKGAKST